jgi:UDP-N-acetylmuramate dehydrogenase
MANAAETLAQLAEIPNLTVSTRTPLSRYTRFAIGGPADIYAETADVSAFLRALEAARASELDSMVMGGGTNLIVSDEGYRGIMLRFVARALAAAGECVTADSGADLQDLVDFTTARGLKGLETLAGIPGSVGAAVYGNAGAYGHSISERVRRVRFFDGAGVRELDHAACEFHYRESIFKRQKQWIIFTTELAMERADPAVLQKTARDIVKARNEKFPVTMRCAGSIFKNFLLAELPPEVASQVPSAVIREGKVPAAFFLEQVGAKGMQCGDIHVADYHANLIYNAGQGTAASLCSLISELKRRVRERYDLALEEEVQYVGFTSH